MFKKFNKTKKAKKDEKNVESKHPKEKKNIKMQKKVFTAKTEHSNAGIFGESRRTIKELIAPNGINPNPLDHVIIHDAGQNVYTMCMYIEKMTLSATFANTFSRLFNYEDITSSVFINPLTTGNSSSKLDKRVLKLDSEGIAASKDGDRNRFRKVNDKMAEAEGWARDIERGENRLYEVSFLFTITSTDHDKLLYKINEFHSIAKEMSMELCACYGCHPEAFVSALPLNRLFHPHVGIVKTDTVKKFIMDKYSLACIFNHTKANFSHKNGILAGRNMKTGQPFTFDTFNSSGNGYNLLFAGKTGTGKSATIKMWLSRYADFGVQIASIDCQKRGNQGEYALMAKHLGGVSFQIKSKSEVVLNPYEINEEDEYDETTSSEYKVLRLNDKLADLENIIMNMIKGNKSKPSFDDETFIRTIVTDINTRLYEQREIFDQDVNSLYTTGNVLNNGRLTSGKLKKELPTIHDFYMEILREQKGNKNPYHDKALAIIIDAMSAYVKELYYCPVCLKEYSKDEFEEILTAAKEENEKGIAYCSHQDGKKVRIKAVRGSRSYYDGQSTVHVDVDTPHVNIDISQLPDSEKPIAQQIAMDYLNENFVKRNSMNPLKVRQMVYLIDELHTLFPYEEARKQISSDFRTARKRNVAVWVATQALSDCQGYEETKSIINNSAAIILLRQDFEDKEYLQKNTVLTPSQVEQVLELGGEPNERGECDDARKGELCLISNDKVTFIKVDYLKASEAYIVETDMKKINEMHKDGAHQGGAVT